METIDPERPEWSEERLRYRILRAVYEQTAGDCTRSVTGAEIGAELDIEYEDLFRVLHFLLDHGYLFRLGPAYRVCITPRGTRYIERAAGRRYSLRVRAAA